jgi:hypothetical protein
MTISGSRCKNVCADQKASQMLPRSMTDERQHEEKLGALQHTGTLVRRVAYSLGVDRSEMLCCIYTLSTVTFLVRSLVRRRRAPTGRWAPVQ